MDPSTASNALRLDSIRDYQQPYIHQLPQEILIIILHLCLGWRTPGKDLTRLRLVCHAWKATVDSAPSLWTPINARDGLQHVRTAIAKTGESPIDLIRDSNDPNAVSLDDFLMAVDAKIAYWRSVKLDFQGRLASFGGLQTSACRSLEKLHLAWWSRDLSQTTPLCLFDGGPAPATLKELSLFQISINLGAMRLSNLSSLVLSHVPHIVTEDILLVLDNSPMLVSLRLQELGGLRFPDSSQGVPIHLGFLTTCALHPPIPVTRFLLSTMHTPSLRRADLSCELDGSIPASALFSPSIAAFAPTLRRLISPAKYVEIEFAPLERSSIVFGGLKITLKTSNVDEYQCLRDVLNSLISYPGANEAGLKAHLLLRCVDPDLENLQLFNCQPMVEELTLFGSFWSTLEPTKAIAALGTRIRNSPNSWLFPDLEVIKYDLDGGFYDLLKTSLQGRYCEVPTAEATSATTQQYPLSLKEIHFRSGKSGGSEDSEGSESELEDKEGFLKEVRRLAGNPKISWRGVLVDSVPP
ncbi:hypothetical protein FRC04_007195 [Tulasnella sp. 424]|nr:hypothetical protein FRC04_007195 [Tulasnella sp. 424]KAG8974630.1 hypothetical protein FRC05_007107 [Tulasnella sp. 425]